jgi:hypothetical protein
MEPSEEDINARSRKLDRLLVLKNRIRLEDMYAITLNCDPDVFLETMLGNIKNDVAGHQKFIRAAKYKKIEELTAKLLRLKKKFIENKDPILSAESELNKIRDEEMRAEIKKFRHYDVINMEKMTPRFLKLAKISGSSEPLSSIRDDNGAEFASAKLRSDHLVKFYKKICPF